MASLSTFNEPSQNELTQDFLRLALDRLKWIKTNRSIAFLPTWINAFVKSRTSGAGLQTVDDFLKTNSDLSIDIRRKLLEARDDVARTVSIREFAAQASGRNR